MRISKGKADPVWIRHLPAQQNYLLHPQFSAKTQSDFRAQTWGTCEPWAPSRLPFISSRMHLFKSHGCSDCIYAAKLFCSKAVWCKRKAVFCRAVTCILKMVQMGSVQVSLTWPGWNTWIPCVSGITAHRPPCLLAWSSNPDLQQCIWSGAYGFPDTAIRPSCIVLT